MSHSLEAVLILLGIAIVIVSAFVLSLCVAAARGDEMARRMLGPASSDEQHELGLLLSMDEDAVPHERRHR